MTRKIFILEILLMLAAVAATAIAWPHLPAVVPTHWGINGQPDGFSPRWHLFLFGPGIMAVIVLTWLLPWLSPRRFEVDTFSGTYRQVMLMVFLLIAFIQEFMLWSAFGPARQQRPRPHRRRLPVHRPDRQPHGKGAAQLLHRRPHPMDPGQRARMERHPPLCRQDHGGRRATGSGILNRRT